MSDAIDLTTAGVKMLYAIETVSGTRPTTGYVELPGVKSTPSLNPAPDSLDATTLNNKIYKTYVEGLKDLGGSLEFTFNLTQALITAWDEFVTKVEAGKTTGKLAWILIDVPGLTEGYYFRGTPSTQGLPAMEVNNVLETTVYIIPNGEPKMAEKPTE